MSVIPDTAVAPGAGTAGASSAGAAGGPASCSRFDECGTVAVSAQTTPQVLIVLDKSGSMVDMAWGTQSKWADTKAALRTVLGKAPPSFSFGLALYPFNELEPIPLDCEKDCCDVPKGESAINVAVAPTTASVPKILAALDGTAPGGGTPTAVALARALEYYTTGGGSKLEGARYVLVVTDGGPNCNAAISCGVETCTTNIDRQCPRPAGTSCCVGQGARCLDDVATKQQIDALRSIGVRTIVLGISGSEAYAKYLNVFAVAGGMPNTGGSEDYFKVNASSGADGASSVLSEIMTALERPCELEFSQSGPVDPYRVHVAVDCEILPKEAGKNTRGSRTAGPFSDCCAASQNF